MGKSNSAAQSVPDRARNPKRRFGQDIISETSVLPSADAVPGSYAYREHRAGVSTKDVGETLARDVRGQKNPHVKIYTKKEFNEEYGYN
jgi:hypothetical protein